MNELQKLPNVGQVLADHLVRIGINTPEQLRTKTAEEVFLAIRHQCDAGAFLKRSLHIRENKRCAFFSIN